MKKLIEFLFLLNVLILNEKSVLCGSDISETCGGTFSGYQYMISSPNYPSKYPESRDCIYFLRGSRLAPCNQEFHLQFLDFDLKPSKNCEKDFLQIGERNIYCGSTVGLRTFRGENNVLKIRFHSGKKGEGKGFKILVTTLPCVNFQGNSNRNYTFGGVTSRIISPNQKNESSIKLLSEDKNGQKYPLSQKSKPAQETSKLISNRNRFEIETLYPAYRPQAIFPLENGLHPSTGDKPSFNQDPNKNCSTFQDTRKLGTSTYLFLPPSTVSKMDPQFSIAPPSTEFSLPVLESIPFRSNQQSLQKLISERQQSLGDFNSGHVNEVGVGVSKENNCNKDQDVEVNTEGNKEETNFPDRNFQANFGSGNGLGVGNRNEIGHGIGNGINSGIYPEIGSGIGSGISPGIGSGIYPGNNPGIGSGINSEIYPGISPGTGPGIGSGIGPGMGSGIYPGIGLGINSEIYPGISPGTGPGIGSGFNPGIGPGVYPETTPGISSGINVGQIGGNDVGFTGQIGGPGSEVGHGLNPGNYPGQFPNLVPDINLNPTPNYPIPPNYPVPPNFPGWSSPRSECCTPFFPAQRSLLSSPGFPTLNFSPTPFECGYTINKFSAAVCRLKLNFKFFNLGSEDPYCINGYLEVDGRRICGCRSGLSLVFPFEKFPTKIINVRYLGFPKSKFNGFLIEVIQEVCGDYYPLIRNRKDLSGQNETSSLLRKEDGLIDLSKSIISHARRKREGYSYPKPTSHAILNIHSGGDRSESLFWNSCQSRVFIDWILAAKEAFIRGVRCPGSGNSGGINSVTPVPGAWNGFPRNCEEIAAIEGVITSPFYPYYYPNNIRKCYRFYKSRGFCRLELSVLDFDLEPSLECSKDYLLFSGQNKRYCGNSLTGTTTVFDLTRTNVAEIYFTTDSSGSGRGFIAGFVQTRC